jgi:dGTPase
VLTNLDNSVGSIRELLEQRERKALSSFAALSADTRGRQKPEPEHEYRTAFQRDRDRILHSKAFRRLKRKTQVFLAPEGDHYRTRLTHTLEVAQIARTVARALFLNEDLTEAIALGHDLGHTPFGHAGESVLNELCPGGFRHFEQSLRVVDLLESTRHGRGLNLTDEVRDGILHHSKGKVVLQGRTGQTARTLEGQIMSVCDAIAYVNHDIDDALRAGVITLDDLPQDALAVLGRTTSERINAMVGGLIQGTRDGRVDLTPEIRDSLNTLRNYLYRELYPASVIRVEIDKAKNIVRALFEHLCSHSDDPVLAGAIADDPLERRVADVVAGMTDQYALQMYQRLFLPARWPL